MIRVMIVDDEPFIRQGLRILIPWEQYGYEVCDEAANGMEALELLQKKDFDLIVTDIKMPRMSGIEFIEYVNEHFKKKIHFIILSGFYEFEYAKMAIKYGVEDYILKPVQKDELISVLVNYKDKFDRNLKEHKNRTIADRIIFDNHMGHLLAGVQAEESIQYIRRFLLDDIEVRYINLRFDQSDEKYLALSNEDKIIFQNQLYSILTEILGINSYHAYKEPNRNESELAVGFIYTKKLADIEQLTEREYISTVYKRIREKVEFGIILYIGQKEKDIRTISNSYKSSKMICSFYSVSDCTDIIFYDDIKDSISTDEYPVDKEGMDKLIRVIEKNDKEMIKKHTLSLYSYFKNWLGEPEIIKINLNYLLFNLINLTRALDSNIDQEELHRIINKWGNDWVRVRSNIKYFQEFALEFSSYLSQLRQHTSTGMLKDIEREIIDNYMDNLSLKTLSEKHFMNTAYLGQIFKKHFGISFKDYLNNYRIERATELLIRTDDKIYLIANSVGFKNTDYFISKFVQQKGITPLQFRKQLIQR